MGIRLRKVTKETLHTLIMESAVDVWGRETVGKERAKKGLEKELVIWREFEG